MGCSVHLNPEDFERQILLFPSFKNELNKFLVTDSIGFTALPSIFMEKIDTTHDGPSASISH